MCSGKTSVLLVLLLVACAPSVVDDTTTTTTYGWTGTTRPQPTTSTTTSSDEESNEDTTGGTTTSTTGHPDTTGILPDFGGDGLGCGGKIDFLFVLDRWKLSEPMGAVGDHASAGGFRAVRAYEGDWAAVEAVILASPRTRRLEAEEGQRLYVTRSALWGFPDYATVRLEDGKLEIYSRLRFGQSDLGVNQARVRGWLADLEL